MSASLDNLTKNLTAHPHLDKTFKDNELLREKGIFPYEYLNSFDVLDEERLPDRDKFYSSLKLESVIEKEYVHACRVFYRYKFKAIRDYLKLYLVTDVVHLCDVFAEFRSTCLKHYGLDTLWFYTAQSLAWNAMLKKTNVELELISDQEVLEFFESQMRGGVSTVFHRYAEANNKYFDGYDSEKPSSCIAYLDANNLYGWAMSKALPTGNFKFLKIKEKEEIFKQLKMERGYTPLESKGRVFEVDLEYAQELHDYHDDYPFLPERLNGKLIPSLLDKKYYKLDEHNLIQALKQGLRLIGIHRVLEFDLTS